MSLIKRCFYLLILILISNNLLAENRDSVIIFKDNESKLIGDYLFIYKDSVGDIKISDVEQKGIFVKSKSQVPNLGVSDAVFWTRFQINNQSTDDDIIILVEDAMINDLTLYTKTSNGFIIDSVTKSLPYYARKNNHHLALFTLKQEVGTIQTYYLRVHGYTQLVIPIKIGTTDTLYNTSIDYSLFSAIYFGVMIVMFLYNLFIYLSVKDKSYLYYILYILSVAFVQLSVTGLGFKYIWPSFPYFEQASVFIFPSLTAFASIAFFRRFLNTKQYLPKLDKAVWLFVIGYVVTLFNASFGNKFIAYNLLNFNALPLALFMIIVAAYIKQKYNSRPASFFLLAWTLFLVGIIVFVLKDIGLLPYNLLTVSSIQIGSAVETVMLSIALADRINTLKKEKEKSQNETLLALQENDRIIREQNVILESKVAERTLELNESNQHLERTLVELQEKETQLVDAEKMASLGQLTAGIAHEINNPINFVTSNVSPLKRDVDALLEMITTFESVSISDATLEEKQNAIAQLKNELDFDYLKIEIEHLLKGIHEGASRTAEIVKGLKNFSRLDEDDLKRVDMNEGLSSTLVIVNHLLNNLIEVDTRFTNLPLIECYPGKLNQVFLNIMSNAIYAIQKKWGNAKGGKLTVETFHDAESVQITISDNGIGMDENTKKKLFEPFFTTKDVGEGTGLGLSIVYNTIKKHNASIEVISELDKGAAFVIKLPLIHR